MKFSILVFVFMLTSAVAFVNRPISKPLCNFSLKMAAVDDAVALYQRKYPRKEAGNRSSFASFGMPVRDIDGKKFTTPKAGRKKGKSFSDREEKDLRSTFKELARLYGEDNALQMVKDLTIVLAFKRNYFAPSLEAFSEVFGEEESKAMVQRNPGLLALPPSGAGGADSVTDQTMQFSYLVGYTRPFGPFLLYGLLFLLFDPFLEYLTGIPIKTTITSALGL